MKKIDRKIFLRVRANNKVIIECRDIYVPPEKRVYNYYVKGTTLRTRYNMRPEDWFNTKKAWIGCDTRNKAKRLIARNRAALRIVYFGKNGKIVFKGLGPYFVPSREEK